MTDSRDDKTELQGAGMADGEPEPGRGLVLVAENVLLQHVSDETVLLDLSSGTYFGLDAIGTRMLDLARDHREPDDIVALLEGEYDAAAEQLKHDLEHLLSELVEAGLVTRAAD